MLFNTTDSTHPNEALRIERARVKGKFIFINDEKFFIRGATYGTFRPEDEGNQFPDIPTIDHDFRMMKKYGINTVRTYTLPTRPVLDLALKYGLRIMAGLPWEQHIHFLESKESKNNILKRVKAGVLSCRKHPAILCFTIGNEIPASIVRSQGVSETKKFLYRMYKLVKHLDPDALVTYVNYPTTEYLSLPFLDFQCFNVYLETPAKLESYVQRLHNLAGDQPLVLAEIGLDSLRNGVDKQAEILNWQIRTIFSKGCAGTFVFAWTDEWWRGGYDIEDWDFGLVTRDRNPKPALEVIAKAYKEAPFHSDECLPFISVVVCTYNGSLTIRDTLQGLKYLTYPNYEVIVVNDGSTDNTESVVREYPVKLITTSNEGLSSARNTGMHHARGEIVAYIDDDAWPDPHWLHYLAYAFIHSDHAGIGGPNIAPDTDGPVATCVAHAPGGPVHVLLTDEVAEHIPGCNMAFRRDVLLEIGGFDPVYRTAGDDVDLCWRIQHTGRTIGFHPAAMVWHHRRNSIRAYWKQQKGYGKAEALLEAKWPEKYNGFGHLSWAGRIYGNGITLPLSLKKNKIFYGVWGSAPFQSVYQSLPGQLGYIPMMPEWILMIAIMGLFSLLSIGWYPLLWAIPFFLLTLGLLVIQSVLSAYKSLIHQKFSSYSKYAKQLALVSFLHLIQPVARLFGRIKYGLTPWRKRGKIKIPASLLLKRKIRLTLWSENWKSPEEWLSAIEANLIEIKGHVRRGGHFDKWDLRVNCGLFAAARGQLAVEEHGAGKQYLKFKCRVMHSHSALMIILLLVACTVFAMMDQAYTIGSLLLITSVYTIYAYIKNRAEALHLLSICFVQATQITSPKDNFRTDKVKVAEKPVQPVKHPTLKKLSPEKEMASAEKINTV